MIIPAGAYRVTITAYDPGLPGTRTLTVATVGHTTSPSASPANVFFDERLTDAGSLKRDVFDSGTTSGRSRAGYGDVVIANGDGMYDAWIGYAFDGRTVIRERWNATTQAWVADLTARMEQAVFSRKSITIKLKDRQAELDVPLQTTKYAGTNALPAGLEGVASDLKGKPKPLCFGSVQNIPATLVNSAKLIYQVHDGAVASIPKVYDRGIPLTASFPLVDRGNIFVGTRIWALAYGAGLFVGVSAGGALYTSPDGTTWTSRTSSFGVSDIVNIVWNGTIFFALSRSLNKAATSPDGITWTQHATALAGHPFGLAYGAGLFVIGDDAGALATSPDGVTWTNRTSPFGAVTVNWITFGKDKFVAVANGGAIATSPDGITWTLRANHPFTAAQNVNGVAYGLGVDLYVATATDNAGATGDDLTASSPDGITWTLHNTGARATAAPVLPKYRNVGYGNGLFYATADAGIISTSKDATAWTQQSSSTTTGGPVIYAADTLVLGDALGHISSSVGAAGTYASSTDLLDDTLAPQAGTYKVYLAGGYFRLGSSPAGIVTADVLEGANAAARTAGQLFVRVLTKAGKTTGDWSAADVTALDTANSAVLGLYVDSELTVSAAIDLVAQTVYAGCWADTAAVFRIKQMTAPSGSPLVSFVEKDYSENSFERIVPNDASRGIPTYRRTVRWGKNYTVQATDLAAGVDPARRAVVENEWREASYTDTSVQTAHLLAAQISDDSLFTTEADALAEATRRQGLSGVQRDLYQQTVQLTDETAPVDLFNVISDAHSRFGLSAGALFRVLGVDANPAKQRVTYTVWK